MHPKSNAEACELDGESIVASESYRLEGAKEGQTTRAIVGILNSRQKSFCCGAASNKGNEDLGYEEGKPHLCRLLRGGAYSLSPE